MTIALGQSAPRAVPDFGLMLNDDSDRTFFTDPANNKAELEPREAEEDLRAMIRSLDGTGVKTLMYSIAMGSDVVFYPSQVASTFGWRETTHYQKIKLESGLRQMARNSAAMKAGLEPLRIIGEEAKRLGLYYFLTLRINDGHFAGAPDEHPLTGRFWMENRDRLTMGVPPLKETPNYKHLFDFSHQEVRDHRYQVISEVVDRYGDQVDGVELDFLRHPYLFPPGTAGERAPLLTELIERIRRKLDQAAERAGRPLYFSVRVPATMKGCAWVGMDVKEWIERRLVDVVVVSQQMTMSDDMPVEEFIDMAKPAGCRVYVGVHSRTQWTWPFVAKPTDAFYEQAANRVPSLPRLRGAVMNYRAKGVDGFQMYNYNIPLSAQHVPAESSYSGHARLMAGATEKGAPVVFAITQAYYLDHLDAYEYRKQLPATLRPDESVTRRLLIGPDPQTVFSNATYLGLRIGLRGDIDAGSVLRVKLNGQLLHDGAAGHHLQRVTGKGESAYHPPATQAFLQLQLGDDVILRSGSNEIMIESNDRKVEELLITEVAVFALFP